MTYKELFEQSGVLAEAVSLYEQTGHLSAERFERLRIVLEAAGATFTANGVLIRPDKTGILSALQCQKARQLVGWNWNRLAQASGIALQTIARFERGERHPHRQKLAAMRTALEQAGVVFTNGDEPGVKLRKAEP